MRLVNNSGSRQNGASIAQVSYSDSGGFGAVAASEARGIPMFAPRGVAYRPCEGDRLLMLLVDGVETCVGCLSTATGLEGGEIKISSAGGATAIFKNNGEISLNGLIITKDGQIESVAGG